MDNPKPMPVPVAQNYGLADQIADTVGAHPSLEMIPKALVDDIRQLTIEWKRRLLVPSVN